MSRIVCALLLASAWLDAHAQSSRPPCQETIPSDKWTDCFGAYFFLDGTQYVGEFRDGKQNGKGAEFDRNGNVNRHGIWRNGQLMTMFEGSTDFKPASRPFNAESTVSLADPSQEIVERERLAAEVDALRKRNDELEKKVKSQIGGAKQTSARLVQLCLSRGLKPGSQQFSICISSGESAKND